MADDVWFDSDAVAGTEMGYGGVDGENGAGGFVAKDVTVFYDHGADTAGMPEVDLLM